MEHLDIKILIVDDEEIILTLFKSALETWGYQADIAEDGQKALQKCSEGDYQILITDLNMPNMDGMSLLKRVKARWPMIEIIVVTGFGTIETAIDAMKMGASDFILKPVNFEQVQFTLKKCCQKIRADHENQALRESIAQLRELNAMKDKFLAITSHEIRTPLTIIKGYLEILEMSLEDQNQEVQETLDILLRTTRQLSETLNRVHTLQWANRSGWQTRSEPINLNAFLQAVQQDMGRLFQHRQILFSVQLPETPVWIHGNHNGLRIIIQELLHNALKFTPNHGRVGITVKNSNGDVEISVFDSGIGIPFEEKELIFTEFYEVQNPLHHKTSKEDFMGGGMGIGLSLVKEMVTSLGGRIDLESEPGAGSTFKIFLKKAVMSKSVAV